MKFLISSFDIAALDLDWRIPIIEELVKQGHTVTVFLPNIYQSTVEAYNIDLLKKYEVNLIYRESIIKKPAFFLWAIKFLPVSMRNILIKSLRTIDKIYLKMNLVKNITLKKIIKIISENDIAIASNYPGIPIDFIELNFYLQAKRSKIFFVGTPIVAMANWYQREIYPFDLFLISSQNEYKNAAKLHDNVQFLGCPCFSDNEQFNDLLENTSINSKTNKSALIILVNNENSFFKDINQINETNNIIKELVANDFDVVIKPHPRNSSYISKHLEKRYGRVSISSNSIDELSKKVDLAISFPSSTIYKVIANRCKLIHYVPDDFYKSPSLLLEKNSIAKDVYYKNIEVDEMWLDKFCIRVGNTTSLSKIIKTKQYDSKEFNYEFMQSFMPKNASTKIIDLIMEAVNNEP